MTPRQGIFVTGGSGFVGRRLLPELMKLGRPVSVLDRANADLLQPDTYRAALESCDVVVHLAARTGAASAAEHERVNARGTEVLVDACRLAGVPKILFVSSIAATFPPNTGYPYADAKRRAEEAVTRSGLRYTIVRPTVIVGPDSPSLKSLEKLAQLPVIVIPGNGRSLVQPVDVGDVATSIAGIVASDAFANEVIEVGGPRVLTMEEHIQQLRVARKGRPGPVMRVPLPLFSVPLRIAEAVGLGRLLPVTAGQLSSFRFDGVTAEHRNRQGGLQPQPALRTAAECRTFTRYLLRCDPDAYVISQYANGCLVLGLTPSAGFDATLLAFARSGWFSARLADSYASLFFRDATLRKRLVLLLALLEVRAPFHESLDRAVTGSTTLVMASLAFKTLLAAIGLMVGTVILGPAHLLARLKPRPTSATREESP